MWASMLGWEDLFDKIGVELNRIGKLKPRGRLPKEEQIRCIAYAHLRPQAGWVRVEPAYHDADDDASREEADLLVARHTARLWMETKRGLMDYPPRYQAKPADQLGDWKKDIAKLTKTPGEDACSFLLVGSREKGSERRLYSADQLGAVEAEIKQLFPGRPPKTFAKSCDFTWRDDESLELVFRLWLW